MDQITCTIFFRFILLFWSLFYWLKILTENGGQKLRPNMKSSWQHFTLNNRTELIHNVNGASHFDDLNR